MGIYANRDYRLKSGLFMRTLICKDLSGDEQSDEQQAAEKPIGIREQKPIEKKSRDFSVGNSDFFTPYLY
jgi:hypothetical protein